MSEAASTMSDPASTMDDVASSMSAEVRVRKVQSFLPAGPSQLSFCRYYGTQISGNRTYPPKSFCQIPKIQNLSASMLARWSTFSTLAEVAASKSHAASSVSEAASITSETASTTSEANSTTSVAATTTSETASATSDAPFFGSNHTVLVGTFEANFFGPRHIIRILHQGQSPYKRLLCRADIEVNK